MQVNRMDFQNCIIIQYKKICNKIIGSGIDKNMKCIIFLSVRIQDKGSEDSYRINSK